MAIDLETIVQQINSGDYRGAEQALRSLLRGDPKNVDAWMLLATLTQDPAQKAACYRQVLRIDPGNRRAEKRLIALSGEGAAIHSPKDTSSREETTRCPQCGGAMAIRFLGAMRDKRAICPFCSTQVDLPDSYSRVERKRTHERRLNGTRTVEETVVETRQDGKLDAEDLTRLSPEIQEALRLLKEKAPGTLDDELLEALKASGIQPSKEAGLPSAVSAASLPQGDSNQETAPSMEQLPQEVRLKTEERTQGFLSRWFPKKRKPKRKPGELSLAEMIDMAGGALPPQDRLECPNPRCGATISKDAAKCPWCGEKLGGKT
jgi:hypothetical protein